MHRPLAIALLVFSVTGDTGTCDEGQSTPWQQLFRRLACPLLRRLNISLSICSASRFEQSRHNGVAVLPSTSAPEVDVPNPRLLVHVRGAVQMRDIPLHSGVVQPSGAHSYNETELLSGDVEAEMRRLKLQVDLTFRKEERLMRWYGLTDGMAVLELGCGPGWTTLRFAEALPASSITCVEKSPRFVAEARRKLDAAGVSSARVTFVHAVAEESGLPDASYDMATFRFVLQHLRQAAAARTATTVLTLLVLWQKRIGCCVLVAYSSSWRQMTCEPLLSQS
ncbi:hypothetical protein AB1Y20_005315 [Prymnesium parvum]|uniref:Methyltransferase domain-containing protein n=1 Tax=Prymnesium parvum TaxID=97485 RepID=A0AB34J487_PRYPA